MILIKRVQNINDMMEEAVNFFLEFLIVQFSYIQTKC